MSGFPVGFESFIEGVCVCSSFTLYHLQLLHPKQVLHTGWNHTHTRLRVAGCPDAATCLRAASGTGSRLRTRSRAGGDWKSTTFILISILLSGQRRMSKRQRDGSSAAGWVGGCLGGGSHAGGDAFGSMIFGGNQGIKERQAQSSVLRILHGGT